MKRLLIALVLSTLSLSVFAATWVNGYYRSDGTYVQGHYRSDQDSSFNNNWSTEGNTNPYTGQKGYKKKKSYWE